MSTISYEKIRINGDFSNVLENVELFAQSVEKDGGPLCHIKMIQFKFNEHEVKSFKEKWSKFKNVMVDVMWLSDWAGNVPGTRDLTNYHNPGSRKKREPCSDLWFKNAN